MHKEIFSTYDSVKFAESFDNQEIIFKKVLKAYDLFCSQVTQAKISDMSKMIFGVILLVSLGVFLNNWGSYICYVGAIGTAYKYIVDLFVMMSLEKSFEFYARQYFNYEVYRESMTYLLKKYTSKSNASGYLLNISKLEMYHHRSSGVNAKEVKKNEAECNQCLALYKEENSIA